MGIFFDEYKSMKHSLGLIFTLSLFYLWGLYPVTHSIALILYTFMFLFGVRIYDYYLRSNLHDLINFCYVVWFAFIYFYFFDRSNKHLFMIIYGVGFGHLGITTMQFRNCIIFHREDISTSWLTHAGFLFIFYSLRWQQTTPQALAQGYFNNWDEIQFSFSGFGEWMFWCFIFTFVWSVIYLFVLACFKERIEKAGNESVGKWALRYMTYCRFLKKLPEKYFDVIWGIIFLGVIMIFSACAFFFYHSQILSTIFVILNTTSAAYYSGVYYLRIYPAKFTNMIIEGKKQPENIEVPKSNISNTTVNSTKERKYSR